MIKVATYRVFFVVFILIKITALCRAQEEQAEAERILALESTLQLLADKNIPELNEKIDFSVSEISVKEFIRAVAEISDINVNVDPSITGVITNNFKNELCRNVFLFVCKEYRLDIEVVGSILSFKQIIEPEIKKIKVYNISYSAYNDLLSIDVRNDTLYSVLKDISQKSGKNVIASPAIKDRLISSFVNNLTFNEAIKTLAFANNLIVNEAENNAILIDGFEIPENNQNQKFNTSKNQRSGGDIGARDRFRSNIVIDQKGEDQLITANISKFPVIDILQSISTQSGKDYVFLSEPTEIISLQVSEMNHDDFLELILSPTAHTFRKSKNTYLIGGRNEEGLRSSELIQLKYRSTAELIDVIPTGIKEGVEIREFKELNGILVSGSKPQISEIQNFVKNLDRLIPVVQIEVIVIDVNKGRGIQTGISAGISDSIQTGGSILPGIDFTLSTASINSALEGLEKKNIVNLGRVNPNFYTSLKALEQNNNIKIRSTPKLATLNGHEASLTIGRTEYYLEQTQNVQGANNLVTTITPQFREISADLHIVINPVVSADEHVTLDIRAEFADFTPSFVLNGPPGKASRQFNSMIRIKNNEMIILGGLEEETKSRNTNGIPFLARIPVLNWIFGERTYNKSESKLMVFIRPTILY